MTRALAAESAPRRDRPSEWDGTAWPRSNPSTCLRVLERDSIHRPPRQRPRPRRTPDPAGGRFRREAGADTSTQLGRRQSGDLPRRALARGRPESAHATARTRATSRAARSASGARSVSTRLSAAASTKFAAGFGELDDVTTKPVVVRELRQRRTCPELERAERDLTARTMIVPVDLFELPDRRPDHGDIGRGVRGQPITGGVVLNRVLTQASPEVGRHRSGGSFEPARAGRPPIRHPRARRPRRVLPRAPRAPPAEPAGDDSPAHEGLRLSTLEPDPTPAQRHRSTKSPASIESNRPPARAGAMQASCKAAPSRSAP